MSETAPQIEPQILISIPAGWRFALMHVLAVNETLAARHAAFLAETGSKLDPVGEANVLLAQKGPCRAATTAAITLFGEQTIAGVAVVADDRVLVKDQSSSIDNGIYVCKTRDWERANDLDRRGHVTEGTDAPDPTAGWDAKRKAWEAQREADNRRGAELLASTRAYGRDPGAVVVQGRWLGFRRNVGTPSLRTRKRAQWADRRRR